jgi:hypothetical protein
MYTGSLSSVRPALLPPIADPDAVRDSLLEGLEWMFPELTITPDAADIRLSMHAPSAEAALAHLRGSYRSALFTAGVWQVGNWPLTRFSVAAGLPPEVQSAVDAGAELAGTAHYIDKRLAFAR